MVELPEHPYFIGCQFHPEFKSRPRAPHPLFFRFVQAAIAQRDSVGTAKKAESATTTVVSA
jgi:CTP synthase